MITTHRRQKAVKRKVDDNNLFVFFTRDTASRRQLKIFAFSCRQFAPQTMLFGCRPHIVVDKK